MTTLRQAGEMHLGPLVVRNAAGDLANGTLSCSVETGNGTVLATRSASGFGVVQATSSLTFTPQVARQDVYYCAVFESPGGAVLYWDSTNRVWGSFFNSCAQAVILPPPVPLVGPVCDLVGCTIAAGSQITYVGPTEQSG